MNSTPNAAAHAPRDSAISQMVSYAVSKGVTDEQWDEILRRFKVEAIKILRGEQ